MRNYQQGCSDELADFAWQPTGQQSALSVQRTVPDGL